MKRQPSHNKIVRQLSHQKSHHLSSSSLDGKKDTTDEVCVVPYRNVARFYFVFHTGQQIDITRLERKGGREEVGEVERKGENGGGRRVSCS